MTRVKIQGQAASHYGPRSIEDVLPAVYTTYGESRTLVLTFSFDDLPVNGLDEANLSIPANAYIDTATLRVITAFAGGTSYDIGLTEPDGTTIDDDGIDVAIALTAMDAVGETVLMDGALVQNLAGIGSAKGQVDIVATGTYTAGKAEITIVYMPLQAKA